MLLGRTGRRLTNNEATRAGELAEAEIAQAARPRRGWGRPKQKRVVKLGRTGRRLTSREGPRAVELAEAEGTKAEVQLGHIGRRLTSREATWICGSVEA